MRRFLCYLFLVLGILAFTLPANAMPYRVSQESAPGAGDFDANVLLFIVPFDTALTTAAFYQYSIPNLASYNGELNGGPVPVTNLSQVFLVDASDGLSLVVVHDQANDGSGGSTRTRWNLTGDSAAQVLADDPGEPVTVSAGGTQFDSTKNWAPCCTDGYAIGSLDGDWAMFGQFLVMPSGITDWHVISGDNLELQLTLAAGQRVRIDSGAVPEPATLLLLGTGLVGLVGLRRKFRN